MSRRQFLWDTGALGAVASMGPMADVPFSKDDAHPRLTPPSGSIDCHMHRVGRDGRRNWGHSV